MDNRSPDEPEFQSYEIALHTLVVPFEGPHTMHYIEMIYDISFVSAWPCFSNNGSKYHLLHQSFKYEKLAIGDLDTFGINDTGNVIVVNIWSSEQRVYVGAWCANKGYSAVVERCGNTCTACGPIWPTCKY